MRITVETLKAAGLSAEQIIAVVEIATREAGARERERWRVNSRNYRSRHRNHHDADDIDDAKLSVKKSKSDQSRRHRVIDDSMTTVHIDKITSSSSESQNKKRKKVSISEDWMPNENGLALARRQGWDDQKIRLEIHRFEDHAKQHDRQCADWQAAWRNWVTSPYQQRAQANGRAKPSLVERGNELARQARELEIAAGYRSEDELI